MPLAQPEVGEGCCPWQKPPGRRAGCPHSPRVLNEVEPDDYRPDAVQLAPGASNIESLSLACHPSVAEQAKQSGGKVLRHARPLGGEAGEGVANEDGYKAVLGANHDRSRRITSMSSPAARVGARTPLRSRSSPTSRSKSCRAASGGRSSSMEAGRSSRLQLAYCPVE